MLEHELNRLLDDAGLSVRQAAAVAARLGWDGSGTMTLGAAAAELGYSRERVRQLEARVREHVARERPALPAVERALDAIEAASPDDRVHIAWQLAATGCSGERFDPAGVLVAAELTGRRSSVRVDGRFVRLRHAPRPDEVLLASARVLASGAGQVDVSVLGRCTGYDPDRVRRLLADRAEVRWLDEERLALGVRSAALDRRVGRILPKLFSVAGRISLADVDDALRRTFNPIVLPVRALRDLCDSLPWLQLDGSTVVSLVRFDRRQVLTPIELALVHVFEGAGPVLSFREVLALTRDEGLNRNSVGVYLTRTPVLKTLGRGRYGLRGYAPRPV